MTQLTRQNVAIPIGPNGQLVNGTMLINSNGDAEWFAGVGLGQQSSPTFTSNASNNYKWQPSSNCVDGVTCPTNDQKKAFYSNTKSTNTLNQGRYDTFTSSTGLNSPGLAEQLKVPNPKANEDPAAADENAEGNAPVGGLEQFDTKLFGEKESFGNLMYPKTMNPGQDRIFINQVQYKRSGVLQREGDFTQLSSVGSVTLPMPNDISETNSVGWGEDSLSNVAAGLMPGLSKMAIGTAEADFGTITGGIGELTKFINGNDALSTRAKQFLTTKAAASLIAKLGVNVNAEAFITRQTGAAINPNLELLFNGPKLRQFGFQFKLTPRDGGEATEIRKILRFFKQGMSPRKGSGSAEFFLGTPNVFKIQFKSGNSELKSIGKIKTCALVSFNANYTPDGFYAAYKDGAAGGSQPVAVTIQLGFTELTPVFNDEYDSNYDDIGPNVTDVTPNEKEAETKKSDNPRSPENARSQAAAEGRQLTPAPGSRSAGTGEQLRSGNGESGGQ